MSTGEVVALLLLAATPVAAGYFLACWIWPYTSCRRCDGSGKKRSPSGRNWRPCKKCGGSGRRVRTGRRVWTFITGKVADA